MKSSIYFTIDAQTGTTNPGQCRPRCNGNEEILLIPQISSTGSYAFYWHNHDTRWVGLVWFSLFVLWHINLCRLSNAKAILLEKQKWYYLTHSWEDKGVHAFPKGICFKLNVAA